jgi:predicted DsbA family dithiol-disulfide isomerase
MNITKHKMQVEIWSDIMCPFCYIGKRKFEAALEQFQDKDNVEIIWKSFQLSPELKTQPDKSIHSFLSEHKGIPLEDAKRMNNRVSQMAKQVGLVYNFDKSVVANSFNAHRFSHFAKQYGKQGEAEEKLFYSYFTDGKNIDDYETLVQLGSEIGLDKDQLKNTLDSNAYADEVRNDIYEAHQVGVRGVPYFMFNNKFAVAGAQDIQVFSETLEKSFSEWRKENPEIKLEVLQGQT